MKRREKIVMISAAICAITIGFLLESRTHSSKNMSNEKRATNNVEAKKEFDICVMNKSGAQVNAAFYTKRMKRHGDLIKLPVLKSNLKKDRQAPILAVATKSETLGNKLAKSTPHVDTHNAKSVCIKRSGHDFVLSTTSCDKRQSKCLKCAVDRK